MVSPALKQALLPTGRHTRTLPAGIGRGLRMDIDFQNGQTRLYLGLYEMELNRHIRGIATRGACCFDLGGAFGYDALVLAKLTGASVVSVESEADLARQITKNAAANPGLDIRVETAFVAADDDGDHVTIDSLAARYFPPNLVKLDIEGGEVDALSGATRTLRDHHPAILLEVHGRDIEWECLGLLRSAGYAPPVVVDRRRWLKEERPLDHNRWLIFRD